jgi:aryl-alcohol dehydrogenase-like predicted oxidoreductase
MEGAGVMAGRLEEVPVPDLFQIVEILGLEDTDLETLRILSELVRAGAVEAGRAGAERAAPGESST